MTVERMLKVSQRSLLQGRVFLSIPCRSASDRACYLVTKSNSFASTSSNFGTGSSRCHSMSCGGRKRQYQQHPKSINSDKDKDAKRFFESSKSFIEHSLTEKTTWTREQLEIANKILRSWPRQTISRELQNSWVLMADQLITAVLDQISLIEQFDRESSICLIPDSTVFSSIITMYSKINLPDSAERADYWLQKMIDTSNSYPNRVTPPRATLYANVLSAWEKSKHSDAEVRAEKLWKQLKSTKRLTPTSSAYYLYISLWSKSNLPEAAEIAEKILKEMVREARRNPKLLPSCPVFVNVISAWRRKKGNDQDHAKRAQAILDLLLREYIRRSKLPQKWLRFSINDVPFNATIDAWVKSSAKPELMEEQVESILKTMDELNVDRTMVTAWSALPVYTFRDIDERSNAIRDAPAKVLMLLDSSRPISGEGENPILQNQIFTKALEFCSSYTEKGTKDSTTAVNVAEEIFVNRYLKLSRKDRRVETTMDGYEKIIKTWKNDRSHNDEQKKHRITELLQKMEREVNHIYMHTHKQNPSVGKLYASLAKAWAMSCYPSDALERASSNINLLLESSKNQSEFKLSPFWFQEIIQVAKDNYSKQVAAEFVENTYSKLLANESQFFRMMNHLEVPNKTDYKPSIAMEQFLNGILDNLLSIRSHDSGRRAEIVLLKQQELHEDGNCLPPTFETFKKVLKCWSHCQDNGAAKRMENMLLLANSLYDAGDTTLRPDFDGYMTVITAWSRSKTPDAPDKIKSHLETLYQRRLEGDKTFMIDSRVYAALIRAHANSGRCDAQEMAYSIFQSAPDNLKDTHLFNLLIEAQGGDSTKAEELLQVMHILYLGGNENAKPDTETFNAVIQAWLQSGSPMAAWRADSIFKRMEELCKTGKLDVKPNSRTFDLVISTLAQCGEEVAKIDMYLGLLKEHCLAGDCVPNSTSYTEAIRAWASKNDDPRAILRAQALLDEMYELVREGVDTVRPNRKTYDAYLEGLYQSSVEDRTEHVNDVLYLMKENEFHLDDDLRSSIQRCLLPPSSRANTWIVHVDESINPKNEWIQSNSI